MKTVLKNYTFDATAKTITLTDVATIRLDRLVLITDTTTNAILYNFADATVSTATVATNVITLSTVGTAASTDKLRIDYDVNTTDSAFGDSVNAGSIVDGATPTIKATVASLAGSNPLAVEVVDGTGTQITSFGGGTQYTTGDPTAGNPIGTMPVFDNGGSVSDVSLSNGLPVNIVAGTTLAVSGIVDVATLPGDNGVSGTIAATNANVAVTGLNGVSSVSILVSGTYTGALTPQISVDGTNWTTLGSNTVLNVNTRVLSATIPSAEVGAYFINIPSVAKFRIIALGAVTGSATVAVRAGSGSGATNAVNATNLPTTVDTNSGNTSASTLRVVVATDQPAIATTHADVSATGNITTQNLNPLTGTATAGSTVASGSLDGVANIMVQVEGTYTGILTPQVTIDGTNWVALSATGLINTNTNAYSATIPSAAKGIYQTGAAGLLQFRISANAAVTGTAIVTIRLSAGAGTIAIDNPIPAGTNTIGTVSANLNASSNAIGAVYGMPRTTSSGLLIAKINAAATTNATSVKASAGAIYGWALTNTTAVTQVVHVYNLATAPTVGTTVPIYNIVLPASGGMVMPIGLINIPCATGVAYSITTGLTDLDATATTINAVVGTIWYI